jgi:hypothetical protein
MTQLSKKESVWSAAIGVLIGSMAGLMISLSMVKETKRCDAMERENLLLKEIILNYQEQEPCGE